MKKKGQVLFAVLVGAFNVCATTPEEVIATADAFDADIYTAVATFAEKCQGLTLSDETRPAVEAMRDMLLGSMIHLAKVSASDLTVCTSEDLAQVRGLSECARDAAVKRFDAGACMAAKADEEEACSKYGEISAPCKTAFMSLIAKHREEL